MRKKNRLKRCRVNNGRLLLALAGLTLCMLVIPARADVAPQPTDILPTLPPMITPDTQKAIERGLDYLARSQSREGAWRNQGYMGQYPVAMTALAGVALLANGNTTTQGKYA